MNVAELDIKKPIVEVTTKISKWKNYRVIEKDNRLYIEGYQREAKTNYEVVTFQNNKILFDLIKLHNQLECTQNIKSNITDDDIKKILRMCKKYGLLDFEIDVNTDNLRDNFFVFPSYTNSMTMDLEKFRINLQFIYLDFLKIIASKNWYEEPEFKNLLRKQDYKKIRLYKGKNIELYTASERNFTVRWRGCFITETDNIIHLSIYYLCMLSSRKSTGTGYINECKMCGKYFTAKRRNQCYCDDPCTKQSYYMRIKRQNYADNQ